jgi:hypothetical protein
MKVSCRQYNHVEESQAALFNDAFWKRTVPERLILVVMYLCCDRYANLVIMQLVILTCDIMLNTALKWSPTGPPLV